MTVSLFSRNGRTNLLFHFQYFSRLHKNSTTPKSIWFNYFNSCLIVLSPIYLIFSSHKMGWLQTDQCCCCIRVRTGGILLGWLGVIFGLLGVIAYAIRWEPYLNQLAAQKLTPEVSLAISGKLIVFRVAFIEVSLFSADFYLFVRFFAVIDTIISGLYLYGIFHVSKNCEMKLIFTSNTNCFFLTVSSSDFRRKRHCTCSQV